MVDDALNPPRISCSGAVCCRPPWPCAARIPRRLQSLLRRRVGFHIKRLSAAVIRHKPSSVSGLLQLPRDHPGRLDTVRSGLGRLAGTARSPRQARRCNGQALAYVYFEDEPGRLTVANRSPAMKRGELLPAFPVAGAAAGRAAARLTGGLPMGDSIGGRAKGLPTTLGRGATPCEWTRSEAAQ